MSVKELEWESIDVPGKCPDLPRPSEPQVLWVLYIPTNYVLLSWLLPVQDLGFEHKWGALCSQMVAWVSLRSSPVWKGNGEEDVIDLVVGFLASWCGRTAAGRSGTES